MKGGGDGNRDLAPRERDDPTVAALKQQIRALMELIGLTESKGEDVR